MSVEDLDNIFLLFAGLFAAHSLSRLQPMKLFDFHRFSYSKPNSLFIKKLCLGIFANLNVASFYFLSWFWYKGLLNFLYKDSIANGWRNILALSIIISSSSIVLASHRVIASIAIYFKKSLFEEDPEFKDTATEEFKRFLNQASPQKHFVGTILFAIYQATIGFLLALVDKIIIYFF